MIGAVDVGGTKIAVGLVDDGRVLTSQETPAAQMRAYDFALGQISRMLREMMEAAGHPLEGIGIGLTGRVDGISRRIGRNDFLPDWQGRDLAGDLSRAFGVGVGIENDADAAALAEAAHGAGKGARRLIYLTVSTGIGGGMVFDGRLYRGLAGSHPEIGHHVIDPSGPLCFCGARGCWERMASGTAMLAWAQETFAKARQEPGLDARRICDLAEGGTAWAVETARREGYYLGVGLANLVTLFAPEQICLGGGLMRRWGLFAQDAMRVVSEHGVLLPAAQVKITPAALGADAPLIGAAQAWAHQSAG